MKNLKKLTILHSNDMHGDFLAEQIDEKLVGGVSFLSGYVNMVRRQEKNVLYVIAERLLRKWEISVMRIMRLILILQFF